MGGGVRCVVLAVALALVAAWPAGAQTVIDTTPAWERTTGICVFGVGLEYPPIGDDPPIPYVTTWGQVVTAPARDTVLERFSFFLLHYPFGGTDLVLRAEVFAWDGAKATGEAVWESAPRTVVLEAEPRELDFATGGVELVAGRAYVLFLTASKDLERTVPNTGACTGRIAPGVYDGGGFAALSDEGDETRWTSTAWSVSDADLPFRASFAAPGPSCADARGAPRRATVVGTAGDDVLRGTAGPDVIAGLDGRDRIHALGGDDVVCAGPGRDRVDAGPGADTASGGPGADLLAGGDGADLVLGDLGSDLVAGGRGDDRLSGDGPRALRPPGLDLCAGQQGADRAVAGTCEHAVGVEGTVPPAP